MDNTTNLISGTENVARLLCSNWVVDGILQHYAFVLRYHETYISVNRPAVSSYDSDVASFIESHSDFYANEARTEYKRALINVGDIRKIEMSVNDVAFNIDVEVEPRDVFTKSHAGIFTRHEGQNLKADKSLIIKATGEEISTNDVLLEVRSHLLDLAQLQVCKIVKQ